VIPKEVQEEDPEDVQEKDLEKNIIEEDQEIKINKY
jgi:hypothetical protein